MEQQMKRLGDAELEVMLVIWRAQGPVTSVSIRDGLRGRRDWQLSTLMTTLARLVDKGFLTCDRSTGANLYSASISQQAYKERESRSFLQRLHGNSLQSLVASLYDGGAVGQEDLAALRAMIDRMEEGGPDA